MKARFLVTVRHPSGKVQRIKAWQVWTGPVSGRVTWCRMSGVRGYAYPRHGFDITVENL